MPDEPLPPWHNSAADKYVLKKGDHVFVSTPGIACLPVEKTIFEIIQLEGLTPFLWSGLSKRSTGMTNSLYREACDDLLRSQAVFTVIALALDGRIMGKECVSETLPSAIKAGALAFTYFVSTHKSAQVSEESGRLVLPEGVKIRFASDEAAFCAMFREGLRSLM